MAMKGIEYMKKIQTFDGGIVERPYDSPNWKNYYTCMNYKTGIVYNANTPAKAAKLAGYDSYCQRWEHRCEGPGCNKLSETKYCPYCNFENRKPDDKSIGILGM
jgi:hypothetical protein